jgi:hypothetical protein
MQLKLFTPDHHHHKTHDAGDAGSGAIKALQRLMGMQTISPALRHKGQDIGKL